MLMHLPWIEVVDENCSQVRMKDFFKIPSFFGGGFVEFLAIAIFSPSQAFRY